LFFWIFSLIFQNSYSVLAQNVSVVVWFKFFYLILQTVAVFCLFPSKSVAFRLNFAFLAKSLQFKLMQRLLRHLMNVQYLIYVLYDVKHNILQFYVFYQQITATVVFFNLFRLKMVID